jgi:hypothetical protein
MTYQTPDGWQLPPRCPQHAAPFGSSGPLHLHAHRALRLFVTAGAWAAGLCLIIGSIALVAGTAGPADTNVRAAAAARSGQLPGHGHQRRRRPAADRAGHLLRTFTGTGGRTTSQFSVAAHSRWELQWLYRCPSRTPGGHLIIREGNAAGNGVSLDEAGTSGHGSTWTYSSASDHFFVVTTNCTWTARVLGHR